MSPKRTTFVFNDNKSTITFASLPNGRVGLPIAMLENKDSSLLSWGLLGTNLIDSKNVNLFNEHKE